MKLWDPKTGQSLATLHAHKSTVMDVKWNENGNWLVTASRDHLLKLFDIRNLSQEVQTFRGHKKEASSVAWHPSHEGLFCSGGSDGAILFWHVGADKEVGAIEQAHDSIVWTLAWHPLGHILCSGSNDHTSKFWTRNRPGDQMKDKYNLNTLPAGVGNIDDHEVADEAAIIPGMGPEDRINVAPEPIVQTREIPGLDLDLSVGEEKKATAKKVPYSKPIPRNFQAQWNEVEGEEQEQVDALNAIVNQLLETTPGAVPLNEVTPNAIILHGKMIKVEPNSKLADAIAQGTEAINKLVAAGEIEELRDVVGVPEKEKDEFENYLQDDNKMDFVNVPDVQLPPPLPSSRFAQNPELLEALKHGSKRKLDQLLGSSEPEKNSKGQNFNGSQSKDDEFDDSYIKDEPEDYDNYNPSYEYQNEYEDNGNEYDRNMESQELPRVWDTEPMINSYSEDDKKSSKMDSLMDNSLQNANVPPPPLRFNTNVPPPMIKNFSPGIRPPEFGMSFSRPPMAPFGNAPLNFRPPNHNFDRNNFNPNFRGQPPAFGGPPRPPFMNMNNSNSGGPMNRGGPSFHNRGRGGRDNHNNNNRGNRGGRDNFSRKD